MSIKHAQIYDSGVLEAASIGAGMVDLLVLSSDIDVLFIANTLDADVIISLPNEVGNPGLMYFPAGVCGTVDFRTNEKRLATGTIQVKAAAGLPTTGVISITAIA